MIKKITFTLWSLYATTVALDSTFYPAYGLDDDIIVHRSYALSYSEPYEQAKWVIELLTRGHVLNDAFDRTDNFRADPAVMTGSAALADYSGSGYDRGHLAPAQDFAWDSVSMSESFFLSNMSPQNASFNRGIWAQFESQVRTWAIENDSLYVVTGPVLRSGLPTIGGNEVAVPEAYYKVLLVYTGNTQKGIGFVMANEGSNAGFETFDVAIDSVESLTGIDFFPVLPDGVEDAIEGGVNLSLWFEGVSPVKQRRERFKTRRQKRRTGCYDLRGRQVQVGHKVGAAPVWVDGLVRMP